jgi:hypothetical protein
MSRGLIATAILVALALACLTVIALLLPVPANAHSWYPTSCCSGIDCEPIDSDFVVERWDGWHIDYCSVTRPGLCISGFVKRGTEKVSQDGGYHACFNASRIICFFVPVNA